MFEIHRPRQASFFDFSNCCIDDRLYDEATGPQLHMATWIEDFSGPDYVHYYAHTNNEDTDLQIDLWNPRSERQYELELLADDEHYTDRAWEDMLRNTFDNTNGSETPDHRRVYTRSIQAWVNKRYEQYMAGEENPEIHLQTAHYGFQQNGGLKRFNACARKALLDEFAV